MGYSDRRGKKMCVLIVKPEGVELDRDTLQKCWDRNSDGAGFAHVHRRQVVVRKGHMKLEDFVADLERVGPKKKMLIHFRIATSGGTIPALTHPFWIEDGKLAMGHNGILPSIAKDAGPGKSDTAILAMRLAKYFPNLSSLLEEKELRDLLQEYIGSGNKLAFLRGDEQHFIINEKAGDWLDMPGGKAWFSNTWWRTTYSSMDYTTHGYSKSHQRESRLQRHSIATRSQTSLTEDEEYENFLPQNGAVYRTDPTTGRLKLVTD